MSLGGALHQKPGQPGRTETGGGEAAPHAVSDEATLARHAQTDWGADDLLGQALARENMARAWKRVKANKGSAGVDGRTVQETGEYLKQAWPDIRARLLDGSYRPSAVRRVGIPKSGGGTRELGIPTAVDRLIQQALLQVLQPLIDPTFSEHRFVRYAEDCNVYVRSRKASLQSSSRNPAPDRNRSRSRNHRSRSPKCAVSGGSGGGLTSGGRLPSFFDHMGLVSLVETHRRYQIQS